MLFTFHIPHRVLLCTVLYVRTSQSSGASGQSRLSEWRDPGIRWIAIGTLVSFVLVMIAFSRFLLWVEARPGAVLHDPILRHFAPIDVSWLTFSIIYIGILSWIGLHIPKPRLLLIGLQSYMVMVLFRMATMWLTPLDPPAATLPLIDHMVESIGPGQRLTRDLFFSGHTSTLVLLGLSARTGVLRVIFLVAAGGVATCVLIQHAHYAIDVFIAPFMAFAAWRIVTGLWK